MPSKTAGWFKKFEEMDNMKKTLAVLLALLMLASLIPACTHFTVDNTITIKGVRYSTSLTELDLSNKNLHDIDIIPLKRMTNLTYLDLSY
ncbi:MAG: leucine-rich repeat domain-containing protein, partial [Oscillospiraceae bacterium]|nr:leucine-rich repeat domain-containing protein [Oscillospiraceae bacterium]